MIVIAVAKAVAMNAVVMPRSSRPHGRNFAAGGG